MLSSLTFKSPKIFQTFNAIQNICVSTVNIEHDTVNCFQIKNKNVYYF